MGPRISSLPTSGRWNMKVNLESTNQSNTSRCYRKKVCVSGGNWSYYGPQILTCVSNSLQPGCCPSFHPHVEPPSPLFSSLPYYPNTALDSDQPPSTSPQAPAGVPVRTPVPTSPLPTSRGQVSLIFWAAWSPTRGKPYLLTYCVLLVQPPDNAGEKHVTEGCSDEHNESIFMDGWRERERLGVHIAGSTQTLCLMLRVREG